MPDAAPQTLYLIDGHAQIFRAFYAIRGGLNSPVTGEPTQASYGIAGMLIKLFATFQPHYVVMALDSKGPTFRDEMFGEYKANRAAPPADMEPQIPRIVEMTRMFGIPMFAIPGAEADDIIATIVRRVLADPKHSNVHIRIVSRDKDLEQLLGDRVTMFDIHTMTTIDASWLLANKGVTPAQVVDLLALTGDTVDNVPGVPGVGEKTAAKLIAEHKSIEGILAALPNLKGKLRENLEKSRESLALSRRLVKLKDDVEVAFEMDRAAAGSIDAHGLKQLFETLGFSRHQRDLDALVAKMSGGTNTATAASPASPPTAVAASNDDGFADNLFASSDSGATSAAVAAHDSAASDAEAKAAGLTTADDFKYTAITTREQLKSLVETLRSQEMVAIDTETIGLGHRATICGISLAWKDGEGVYIPLLSPAGETHLDTAAVLDALRPVLEAERPAKTGHNLKYDLLVLREAGAKVSGVAFDSLIASHLIGSKQHGLDDLALTRLKHRMVPITRLIGTAQAGRGVQQKTMDQVPLDLITPYAAGDADVSLRLYRQMEPELKVMGMEMLARDIEMPLVEVLAEMEFNGIRVDADELSRQQKSLTMRINDLRHEVQQKAGVDFNPDSPKQLADVLFNTLGLPAQKRTKSGPSTDIEVLETLAELEGIDPAKQAIPKLIVEYRQLAKLVGTYLGNLRDAINAKTGRVHASFHQTGAATGRLSSNNPNLQNIPIRTEIGREIRKAFITDKGNHLIAADYSQIELRILAHLSGDANLIEQFEKDLDIHTAVAAQVFNTPLASVTRDQRAQAKVINFGIIYGVTPYGLARRIEGMDVDGAKKLIADYRKRFKGIDEFLGECVRQAVNLGYVATMCGRRRPIPEITSTNAATQSLGERLAINTVVQGSAADLIKLAMVNLHRRIQREKLPMRMLLQIHDELVLECPAGRSAELAGVVKQEMESAMNLKVPLKVDTATGATWFEAD